MPHARLPMLIDCDPGHDDALALMLADHVGSIVGVTTVSGNAPLAAVTANALSVLELLDLQVPVHSGADGPLVRAADGHAPHAPHVHGALGLGGSRLPTARRSASGADAVEFLLAMSREQTGLWLVALGPLTNVARALERDPQFARRLAGISIMGGSTAGGNVTAAAEFNIWADPEAAARVFESGARIRLCGLNLTHQMVSDAGLLDRLVALGTPRSRFAVDLLEFLHERMLDLIGVERAALHDPCAVLAVTHPELFEFRRRPVAVELDGTLTRGMTVVDERRRPGFDGATVEVAYVIDAAAAMKLILASLSVA